MKHRVERGWAWIAAVVLLASGTALAADPPKAAPTDPSSEQRQKMAEAHRQLATCLESERPFGECRSEMMERCRGLMGDQGCMMMGPMGGMGHRGMHGGMPGGMPGKEPAK